MRRPLIKGRIPPKISTMPRQQSEAAAFLDIYKLVIEKRRLQQELQVMEQRRQQILDRLTVLDVQVAGLEDVAHQLRGELPVDTALSSLSAKTDVRQPPVSAQSPTLEEFETIFFEY